MPLRIRHQILYRPYKRTFVEIISVDQFTRMARKIEKSQTERQHLAKLLETKFDGFPEVYTLPIKDSNLSWHNFWLEKP